MLRMLHFVVSAALVAAGIHLIYMGNVAVGIVPFFAALYYLFLVHAAKKAYDSMHRVAVTTTIWAMPYVMRALVEKGHSKGMSEKEIMALIDKELGPPMEAVGLGFDLSAIPFDELSEQRDGD